MQRYWGDVPVPESLAVLPRVAAWFKPAQKRIEGAERQKHRQCRRGSSLGLIAIGVSAGLTPSSLAEVCKPTPAGTRTEYLNREGKTAHRII